MKKEVAGLKLELREGDIAKQKDITAVVNAANAQLRIGGGVAGAIHRQAGPKLAEATRSLAPIEPGEAVITKGYNLPNSYVIHCLGPVYGRDKPEDELLADCYNNALDLAEENSIDSIAFPAISTGAFGYPLEKATRVALNTIKNRVQDLKVVDKIRFVLYTKNDLVVYQNLIEELL